MKPLALDFSSSQGALTDPPPLPLHHLPQLRWMAPSPAQAPPEKSPDFLGLGGQGSDAAQQSLALALGQGGSSGPVCHGLPPFFPCQQAPLAGEGLSLTLAMVGSRGVHGSLCARARRH